ncbi:Transcription termination/antitermination protein NusG [Spiroplasma sp. JKS002671]|uniref:transcription termination/antitermination protein NusG n=1 Tax=Spiroplasma attinicola TaxID=2904537 RepID=UPI002022ABEB|nr:transcription termination/antitermination protein NusG [Spiroplasma sp. JKS002671]MCL8210752.1 Transcription termination/antitermination protein NusG [Spiroplasma sp. JKS002671]
MNKKNEHDIKNVNDNENQTTSQASNAQWYVINCNKGHERRVYEDLKQKIETLNLKDKIFDIKIIEETITNKDKKPEIKNAFPGYIFINMIMTDETWYDVRNTPGVTGFIGSSGRGIKPLPLSEKEVNTMLHRDNKQPKKESVVKKDKSHERDFQLNDYVHIISGALKGHEGQVSQLDDDKGVATVNIDFFGRSTPVKVEYVACKKIGS